MTQNKVHRKTFSDSFMFNCLHVITIKKVCFASKLNSHCVFFNVQNSTRISSALSGASRGPHAECPTAVLILFRGNIWPPSCAFWADSSSIRHTGSVQQEQESSQRTASRQGYKANDLWRVTLSDAPTVALTFNRGSYLPWILCLCNRECSLSSSVYSEELQPHIEAWIILFIILNNK